jgi:2,4-dienoyl-CoA reductase-like NADH-dependent reductase (Old Yellow Enzyme family)
MSPMTRAFSPDGVLADLVNRGEFDLVALGRASLADPHWAVKVSSGRLAEIRPYNKSAGAFLY